MPHSRQSRWKRFGAGLGGSVVLAFVVALGALVSDSGAASTAAPKVTSQPTISGTPREGQTLTANNGSWSGTQPITFGYLWQRCDNTGCHEIYGANKQTYTLVAADVGKAVRVKVTATNSDGGTLAITDKTAVVTAAPVAAPKNTSPPTISGTTAEGKMLTGDKGQWTNNPSDFNYFWMRCDKSGGSCADIGGAHAATYTLTSVDVGNTLRFRVQASNGGGSTTATSVPTALVTAASVPVPVPAPAPAPSGCPSGSGGVSVNAVASPARLLIDQIQFSPPVVRQTAAPLVGRFHVTACGGRPVQGALIYATAVPFNQLSIPSEQATGADGWAELDFHTLRGFPVSRHQQLIVLFARARKPGENLLAGISTRRLVSVHVNLNL